MATANLRTLQELARAYGVQTAYTDVDGRRRIAPPEVLLHVLRMLGAPVKVLGDVPSALRLHRLERACRLLEPVAVAWQGAAAVEVRQPLDGASAFDCRLELETGETREWAVELVSLAHLRLGEVDGVEFLSGRLPLPVPLPQGYHRLTVRDGIAEASCLVIASPRKVYGAVAPPARGAAAEGAACWGLFVPLWALRSRRSGAVGDFTDLAELMRWTAGLGGDVVGTLPLLATFLDGPFEPSPYSPVTRLFWNELYLDPAGSPVPGVGASAELEPGGPEQQAAARELREQPLVDYRRAMQLKRPLLQQLADRFFAAGGENDAGFRRFVQERPELEAYARFRAVVRRRGTVWQRWPARLRDGVLRPGDYDERDRRFHVYVQWLAHHQLGALRGADSAARLYLDLPLGAHPDGFDVWCNQKLFVEGVSGGAPPDTFFTRGQDWGFPPLHPERIRQEGHAHFRACVRNHMRYADILRIDHVMSLHRLFWVPHGLEARDGVYLRYPTDELNALIAVESHRHRTIVVGEDLGTVPAYVRRTMDQRGMRRIFVVQYEAQPNPGRPLRLPPSGAVAGLNTHDMPTFAGFCRGLDLRDRQELGLIDEAGATAEVRQRRRLLRVLERFLEKRGLLELPASEAALLEALLQRLCDSPAGLVLVSLEDLWLEEKPHNVPGTHAERPNWRRPARYLLEEFCESPDVLRLLCGIDARVHANRTRP